MSDLEFKRGIFRTSGKNSFLAPKLEHPKTPRFIGMGGESMIRAIDLSYVRKKIPGLVYKKFTSSIESGNHKERLERILLVWEKIRRIKQELQKKGEPGFNIPPTIRGYLSLDGQDFGLLLTDLTHNGKTRVLSLKNINFLVTAIKNPHQWEHIKAEVVRDVQIATENNINLYALAPKDNERKWALDPWLLSEDSEVYLSDIGEHVELMNDSREDQEKIRNSHRIILEELLKIDGDLKRYWEKAKQNKF